MNVHVPGQDVTVVRFILPFFERTSLKKFDVAVLLRATRGSSLLYAVS